MAIRGVGVAGFMLLYAFYSVPKPRSQPLRRMAEILIGLYLGATLYSTLESPEEREAFLHLVPGSSISLYVFALFIGTAFLCYLPGLFVYDVTMALLPVMLINTIFVDCNIHYWTTKRGIDFWNQIRLTSDNIAILMGVIMMLVCSVKTLPVSAAELRRQEEREHGHTD